jgi:hypothetical protein
MYCGHRWVKRCGVSDASKCGPCSDRNRRLVSRKAHYGLTLRADWYAYLLTVTCPSEEEHDQWDPGFLRGSRPRCGCSKSITSVGDWNPQAGKAWNRLRTALRREYDQLEFHRFVEVQDGKRRKDGIARGALHHHVLVVSPLRLDVLRVQDLAMAAGYGCIVDLEAIPPKDAARVEKVARYVAKYVTKGSDRDLAHWNQLNRQTGEVTSRATYQTHSSSHAWGITMKEIRAHLRDVARRRAADLKTLSDPSGTAPTGAPAGGGTGPAPDGAPPG